MADSLERSSCELVIECLKIELQHWGISFFNSLVRILSGLQEGEKWMARRIPRQESSILLALAMTSRRLTACLTDTIRSSTTLQHLSLATGLPQFPAICGLYKHSSTRVQRVALDWLRNNIQYYILLQSFFTINNNSIYVHPKLDDYPYTLYPPYLKYKVTCCSATM